MNYSQVHFGKDREQLTWRDIEQFFATPKDESDSIEFKSFVAQGDINSKYDGLCKSLCAFLNSSGGVLIWGAPIGQAVAGRKEKVFQGTLAPINQILEKDTLIRIVSSRINPLPAGIKVKIIVNGTNCICIFEIEKGISAYQLVGTYYMRIDGQSVPAPHHYVEALIKQVRYPDLGGYLKFTGCSGITSGAFRGFDLSIDIYIFNWSEVQNEKMVSFRLTTNKGEFLGHGNPALAHRYSMRGKQLINNEIAPVLHFGTPVYERCTIRMSTEEWTADGRQIELYLHFGGETSPMKQSWYKVLMSGPNVEILEFKEGVLMSEQNGESTTREEKLRFILGR